MRRLINATRYSLSGLAEAARHEDAMDEALGALRDALRGASR